MATKKAKAAKPKAKAAAKAPPAEPRERPKPQRVARAPRAAPKPAEEQRDFLVVYEEPDPYGLPSEDALILDIEANIAKRGQVDVQQKLDLELTNTTSRLGTFGFVTACVGALLAVLVLITYAIIYPGQWYDANGLTLASTLVKSVLTLGILAVVLMVGGTVLTHYGRRIQARGALSDVRLVEREPVPTPQFQ
jgi:hypothetical protein